MSGTQSALFGGGSRWITNPKHLNKISAVNNRIALKLTAGTNSDSSFAAFFTALALRGAQTSITIANTYVTVANLTGAGFLVNLISPTHSAAFTPTFRLTVDGTVYTSAPSAAQSAGFRMFAGPYTPGGLLVAGGSSFANAENSNGFQYAPIGGLNQINGGSALYIVPPEEALALNLQVLRFETSLLIEMKCDLLSAAAVDKQCGATYVMDV